MTAPSNRERLLSEFPLPAPDAWRRAAEASLDGASFEKKLITRLPEGIDLQPIYGRGEADRLGEEAGSPGHVPFTRGSRSSSDRPSGWRICQELPYGKPDEFNQALLQDLNRGQDAVNLLLDVATRAGLDPDEAKLGEVGVCGLSIATLDDLGQALKGVDLASVPIYAQGGISGLALTAMLAALLKKQGRSLAEFRGGVLTDPVGELAQSGTLPISLDSAFELMATAVEWSSIHAPGLRTVGVQSNIWAEAGGHAVQELGFGLATAADYLRRLEERGCPPALVAPRILFTSSLGSNLFVEIAKLRAARLIWSRVLETAGIDPAGCGLVCHGRSAMWNKSILDPHVNMLRATSEAFAGIVGGCQSIHISAYDECFRVPDDFSRRIARNTQLILGEECHLARVLDPAGGSWYVETLTRQLAERAWSLFQAVEERGGMCAALAAGFPQMEIARSAAARQAGAEGRRDGIVGTNLHPNLKEKPTPVESPDFKGVAHARGTRVVKSRLGTDVDQSDRLLGGLSRLLNEKRPERMTVLMETLSEGATLGEVMRVLATDRSSPPKVEALRFRRRSEPFESLRRRAESHRQKHGSLPKVFLANMGPRKQHAARAEFSAGFYAAGGFEVVSPRGFTSVEEAVAAAKASGAPVVTICSTDETYPALVPPLVSALKAQERPPYVVLAGFPAEQVEVLKRAGVDEFIHLRANAIQVLTKIQQELGA